MILRPLPETGLRAQIAANLGRHKARKAFTTGLRPAAVTVCLMERAGIAQIVVIKRVARGRHAGQWALPGGRVDLGETPAAAALRELREEIGVCAAASDIAGALDDVVSGSGFVITPYVVIPRSVARLRRNPDEVHSIHPLPVDRLLDATLPRWRTQPDGVRLLQMPLRRGMVIHAPTGTILWQLREVGILGRTWHQIQVSEPDFIRRGK